VVSGVVRGDSGPEGDVRIEASDASGKVFTGPWGEKTGVDGGFSIDVGEADWPVRLRIGRQGYLVVHLDVPSSTNRLAVQLERGESIEGLLVDENGDGVPSDISTHRLDEFGA